MASIDSLNIAGVILAAGASSRLGRAKQLLIYQGETLLDRTVGFFDELPLQERCLVYGARRSELKSVVDRQSIRTTYNPDWATGMGSSLQLGLRTVLTTNPDLQAVLIALVDQPLVTTEDFLGLITLHQGQPQAIIAAAYEDTLGVPVIFPAAFFPELLAQKGQVGAKKMIKKYKNEVISYSCPKAAFDIDTEADYQGLLSR
ncbi:MAG TPA: nucleotidyltransferase family protein [Saprospiraceae bacterium]|nr:nucleotidyltransferase family protein [Saprospiraceae bacterium]